jgi:hypothetical protein
VSEVAVPEPFSVGKYDQRVKDLAFVHYVLMDRHPNSAYRSMMEVWDDDLGSVPPTARTIARWAREENWSYKADVEMSKMYPALFQRDMARMVALRGRAISAYSKVLAGEPVPNSMAVAQIARHILEQTLGGLAVQTPQSADGSNTKDLETKDLVARQRERLEKARG